MAYGLGLAFGLLTITGCIHWIVAAWLIGRLGRETPAALVPDTPVVILKPLHGAEPGLRENLMSFISQDYAGPTTVVFGVQDPRDPAIPIVEDIIRTTPERDVTIVVDSRQHGSNPKISNLINMISKVPDGIVVLADSDIRVERDYLSRIVATLQRPGVGAVTFAYHGRATRGLLSRLSSAAIDGHFLPNVIVGVVTGLAAPCFGATIALRGDVLDRIGGFAAFSNVLADDYAIGRAVRRLGLAVEVSLSPVTHMCNEATLGELVAHEIRWAKTVANVDRIGFLGSGITHIIPLSVVTAVLLKSPPGILLIVATFLCRCLLLQAMARRFNVKAVSVWLLPIRDFFSFYIYLISFLPSRVRWKGRDFMIEADGSMIARRGSE